MPEPNPPPPKVVRILAIDGGGVGGIIPARILTYLTEKHPTFLERVDLLAGTSTGGLISLGLACGKTPAELSAIYKRQIPVIFGWGNRRTWVERTVRAKFRPTGLEQAVREIARPDLTLGALPGKPVFIPVTAVVRPDGAHSPAGVFLSTAYSVYAAPAEAKYCSPHWRCLDAAMATAAAPTYFPAHEVDRPEVGGRWMLWDGGIVANNPAMAAVAEVYRLHARTRVAAGPPLPDVRVLSFGTGYLDIPISGGDWGLAQSAQPVVAALMDASVGSTAYMLKQFLGNKVARVTPQLGTDYAMDDPKAVGRLEEMTDRFCEQITVSQTEHSDRIPLADWLTDHWFD